MDRERERYLFMSLLIASVACHILRVFTPVELGRAALLLTYRKYKVKVNVRISNKASLNVKVKIKVSDNMRVRYNVKVSKTHPKHYSGQCWVRVKKVYF
jgi:hypothetical protein